METLYLIITTLILGLFSWFFHYIINSGPLNSNEVDELAKCRRFVDIIDHFGFRDFMVELDKEEKNKMKTSGQFYKITGKIETLPSMISILLKGKKHEWSIVGIARNKDIIGIWANKGLSNQEVNSYLSIEEMLNSAKQFGADTIVVFHNHTNGVLSASDADVKSSINFGKRSVESKINYFDFIIARGKFHQYAWWVTPDLLNIVNYIKQIGEVDGTGMSKNYDMRMELRRMRNFKKLNLIENASSSNIFN